MRKRYLFDEQFDPTGFKLPGDPIPETIRKDQCPLSGVRFDGIEPEKQDILKNLMAGIFNTSSIQK